MILREHIGSGRTTRPLSEAKLRSRRRAIRLIRSIISAPLAWRRTDRSAPALRTVTLSSSPPPCRNRCTSSRRMLSYVRTISLRYACAHGQGTLSARALRRGVHARARRTGTTCAPRSRAPPEDAPKRPGERYTARAASVAGPTAAAQGCWSYSCGGSRDARACTCGQWLFACRCTNCSSTSSGPLGTSRRAGRRAVMGALAEAR